MRRLTAVLAAAFLLSACGQDGNNGNVPGNLVTTDADEKDTTLAGALAAEPRFAALIEAAGMTPVLEGREPYTVLAPTGEALDALPAGTLERLRTPQARAELTGLLRRHILPGTLTRADLERALAGKSSARLASMAGDPLTVTSDGGALRIDEEGGPGVRLVGDEQRASNGVVHRIDGVLRAPSPAS